jgi:hypothetical protein
MRKRESERTPKLRDAKPISGGLHIENANIRKFLNTYRQQGELMWLPELHNIREYEDGNGKPDLREYRTAQGINI